MPIQYLLQDSRFSKRHPETPRTGSSLRKATLTDMILVKNNILIHQPNIPGRAGNKGFQTKGDAEKVAKLIIKKLQQGIMPPATSTKELDSLKVKY